MRPGLPTIGGFVDSVANRNAVTRPRLARPNPDVLRVPGIECNSPDRLHRLFVKDRLVMGATIFGFPNAPAGRASVKGDFPGGFSDGGKSGDATTHRCGANI